MDPSSVFPSLVDDKIMDHDSSLKLRQKIAELELALANQTSSSNKEVMDLEERITRLRASFEKNELSRRKVEYELTAARKELNDEIRKKKQEFEAKMKELDSCKDEIGVKSKDLKSMEKVLHDQGILFDKERDRLAKEMKTQEDENSYLRKESDDLKRKIEDLTNKCSVATVQINSKNVEIEYTEKLLKDQDALFQKEKENISKELEELKSSNADLRTENEKISMDARNSYDELINKCKHLEDTMAQKLHELKTAENKNQEFSKEKEVLVKEVTYLKQENDRITQNWRDKTDELNEKCSLLETQRIEHTSTIHKLVEDNKSICNNEQEWMVKNKDLQTRNKTLIENIEAERASHLETKFNTEILELQLKDIEKELMNEKENLKVCTISLEEVQKKCLQIESDATGEKTMYNELKEKLDKRVYELESRYEIQSKELTNKSVALSNVNLEVNELKEELADTKSKLGALELEKADIIMELKLLFTNYGGKCGNDEWSLRTILEVFKPLLSDSSAQIRKTENNLEIVQESLEKLTIELEAHKRDTINKDKALEEADLLVKNAQYHCSASEIKCSDYEKHLKILEKENNELNNEIEQKEEGIRIVMEDARTTQLELDQTIESTLSALTVMYDILMTGAVQPSSYTHSFSINELKDAILDKLKQNINNDRIRTEELDKFEMNVKRMTMELRHHKKANRKLRKVNAGLLSQTEKYLEDAKKEKLVLEEHLKEYNTAFKGLEVDRNNAIAKCNLLEKSVRDSIELYEKTRDSLCQYELENKHLVAAVGVITGGLWGLIVQHRLQCMEKYILADSINQVFSLKGYLLQLVNMINVDSADKHPNIVANRQCLRGIFRFRIAVIVVLGANRFSKIARHTRTISSMPNSCTRHNNLLFYTTWKNDGNVEIPSNVIDKRGVELRYWVHNDILKKACLDAVAPLLVYFTQSFENHGGDESISLETLVGSICKCYNQYLNTVNIEMDGSSSFYLDFVGQRNSLCFRLGLGLKRLLELEGNSQMYVSVSRITSDLHTAMIESIDKHIHSEKERKSLMSTCERYKEERNQLKSEISTHIAQLEETEKTLKSHVSDLELQIEQAISEDQFNEVCVSLDDALKREKSLQVLLKQQKNEIHEITSKIEKQEECYQQSIDLFTSNIKGQQKEFQCLQGKMGELKDMLSKLETEKEELNGLLEKEQGNMEQFCLERDLLVQFIHKVASAFQKNGNNMDISIIDRLDKLMESILPEKVLDLDGKSITPEMLVCQNTVVSLVDVNKKILHHVVDLTNEKQQLCTKINSLEHGAKAHRMNVQKLKSQISALCQEDCSDLGHSSIGAKETSSPIFVPLQGNYDAHF